MMRNDVPFARGTHLCALIVIGLALAIASTGCKRKPEDLEVWRPSKARNGLEKLQEWTCDPGQLMETRIRGTEILLEEEYAYAVQEALNKCSEADKATIMAVLVPMAMGWYDTKDFNVDSYMHVGSKQAVGKDALFHLYPHMAKPEDKQKTEASLLDWLANGEYTVRDQIGKVRLIQLVGLLGSKASDALLKHMEDPKNSQTALSKMLLKMNDPAVTKKTNEKIIKMSEGKLAELHKDIDLMQALFEIKDDAVVPLLVKIVPNDELDPELRSTAFESIKTIKGKASLPIFLKWVEGDSELLRWLSLQGIAESQGRSGLAPSLSKLPLDKPYGADDPEGFKGEAERFCTEEVKKTMKDTEAIFISQLNRGKWPGQAMSLCCLQYVGTAKSRAAVEKLTGDKTPLPAWGELKTLGDLAKETLGKLPK